jgi:hypothetical protein
MCFQAQREIEHVCRDADEEQRRDEAGPAEIRSGVGEVDKQDRQGERDPWAIG